MGNGTVILILIILIIVVILLAPAAASTHDARETFDETGWPDTRSSALDPISPGGKKAKEQGRSYLI